VSGARTEEATPKRLRRAREEGDTGASAFASQAIAFLAGLTLVPTAIAAIVLRVEERLRDTIQLAATAEPDSRARFDLARAATDVVVLSLPLIAAIAVTAAAASLVQSGGVVGVRRLAPRLDGMNPFRPGALVTRVRLFAVARALTGGGLVGWVVVHALRLHAVDLIRTTARLAYVGPTAATMTRAIGWDVALFGLAIAAADAVAMRLDWRRRLRMSRDEVKRETREAEGDPLVRETRDRARREILAAGAIGQVRTATLVVRDGARIACALRYEDGVAAPVVVASSRGEGAEALVREAWRWGVAVEERGEVARALVDLAAGDEIPEALYDAVAEILRPHLRMDGAAQAHADRARD
jgi:flagellar biosynthesis protein FlhB